MNVPSGHPGNASALSRRTLLLGGVAVAGATLGGLGGSPGAVAAAGSAAYFAGLMAELSSSASLFVPGDASYEALAAPYNHQFAGERPKAILVPSTVADVQAAVRWCRTAGVQLTPRSGDGHNYAGFSNSDGLIVLMSRFTEITITPNPSAATTRAYGPVTITKDAATVRVGAGVTVEDLHPLLEQHGYLVPTGRCRTVGIAGLTLGGGIGLADKEKGLTCDQLLETTVVLADGRRVTASAATEPDLFWACRGGAGGNFGVHTDFTFRCDRIVGDVTVYQFSWSIASAVAAMTALQAVCEKYHSDHRLNITISIGTAGATSADVTANAHAIGHGQFFGDRDDLLEIFADVLKLGTPEEQRRNRNSIQQMPAAEASTRILEDTFREQFTASSAVLDSSLSTAQLETIVNAVTSWPGSRNRDGASVVLFGLGGAINERSATETAFVHRDSRYIAQFMAAWGDDDPKDSLTPNRRWLDDLYTALFGNAAMPMYQNFPDPYATDAHARYYGANHPRLRAVKKLYDPTEFFSYPQSIRPL